MQDLARAWKIFGSFCQEYPILGQELPPPPPPSGLELLMEDLEGSDLRLAKNTLFLAKNPPPPFSGLELLMDDLEGSGLRLAKNAHPPGNGNLVRTWDFEFWVAKNTPCPPEKWKFDQDLGI